MNPGPERRNDERWLDGAMSIIFATIAALAIARSIDLVETHAPDMIVTGGSLGIMALAFTAASVYEWDRFTH